MSQTVRITVHPHELGSALDAVHQWSSQFDWGGSSGSPSFIIELDIASDEHGFARKFTGNRFDQAELESTPEPTAADRIRDMIRNQDQTPPAFSLMNHLKEKARG
jgi:hypothetical protein